MGLRVLITGCSSGIGRALCEELVRRRYDVIATARSVRTLDGLSASMKLALDVTSDVSVANAISAAERVDAVVNNAGLGLWGPVESTSIQDVKLLFETNVFGPLRVLKAALPQMRARREGMVVQVSSVAGQVSGPLFGHYAASKHALEAQTEALRLELAPFGVKVALAEIGAVESDFPKNRLTADFAAYAEVAACFSHALAQARRTPASARDAAHAIANMIDSGCSDLRCWCTPDAQSIVNARRAVSDAEWERTTLASARLPDLNVLHADSS